MSEWIKADLLMQKLHNLRNGWSNNNIYVDGFKNAISSVEGIVEEITTEIPKWIDVNERLPENDYGKHWKDRQYYLVVVLPSGLMRVAKYGYKDNDWWIDSHDCVLTKERHKEVTHWMPLPKPPKGVAETG